MKPEDDKWDGDWAYLGALEHLLAEWLCEEDEEAFRNH